MADLEHAATSERADDSHRLLVDAEAAAGAEGEAILGLMRDLYPLPRSITGPGLRATLARLHRDIPLQLTEVPTGTRVFDWTIPPEWSISEAWLADETGRRVVDFADSNLHVLGYSAPVDTTLSLEELRPRLHSLPAWPDRVPFRSSYYHEDWGFCLADRVLQALKPGRYRAVIRSRLAPGSLTLAEHLHPGRTADEVLIFTHTCHPSLCNDNLSGIGVAARLAAFLRNRETRYSYRFLFAPATIGSIAWMALNEPHLTRIRHGLVLGMLGDDRPLLYKASRAGDNEIDRAARVSLRSHNPDAGEAPYSPWGLDERQFATPGIRLPVGRLTRSPPGGRNEEHTSADDFGLVSAGALAGSWLASLRILDVLERNGRYRNLQPKGEPQLGPRGLYRRGGGYYEAVPDAQLAVFWVLNQCDGDASLLDITERSGLSFGLVARAASDLQAAGLLAPA